MRIEVTDITGTGLMQWAMKRCGAKRLHEPLAMYRARHSVLYARLFWVDIEGVTNRVHSHLVRSSVGVDWWVESQRPDRGGKPGLRNMSCLINSEALIVLAQKRLCKRAFDDTRDAVLAIRDAIEEYDPALAAVMQPRCVWEGRCRQERSCGWYSGQCLPGDV